MSNEVHLPQVQEPTPLILIQQALEAKIPASELKGFFDLQVRAEERRAEEAYAEAITGFQAECPTIHKSKKGAQGAYSYAPFEDIMRAITPLLRKWRIVVTFDTAEADGKAQVTCRTRVGVVEKHSTVTLAVAPASKMTNDTQQGVGAISYGKRTALCAALNIVCTDEDHSGEGLDDPLATEDEIGTLYDLMKAHRALVPNQEYTMGGLLRWKKLAAIRDIRQSHYCEFQAFLQRKIAEAKKGVE